MIYAFILGLLAIWTWNVVLRPKTRHMYPPGPKGDPLIGHVRIMPLEEQWKVWGQWGKQFGDLIYARIFNQDIVILNSVSQAKDLLERRSSNYSDRPRFVTLGEMMGFGTGLTFLRYGHRWRRQRRMIQQYMNPKTVVEFRPLQRYFAMHMLNNLLEDPERFMHHLYRSISSQMVMATYGHKVESENDKYVTLVEKGIAMIIEYGAPGTTAADLMPWLANIPSWMPGAGFKRHAQRTKKVLDEMHEYPFEKVKRERANGTAKRSLVSNLLRDYEQKGIEDPEHVDDIKGLAGMIYAAGVETTADILISFVLAMVINPRVVKKAQEELDRVVGNNRLPELADRSMLPYLECVFKETLRWNPPLPLGITHRAIEDDTYEGYHIPAGSTMIINVWHMTHDEKLYQDPESFIPERFEKKAGQPEPYDSTFAIFGFGRRVCPGRHMADTSLWQAFACILSVFDILPPLDKDGKEYFPEPKFTVGATSQPAEFKCRIVPRSEKSAAVIRQNLPQEEY